jgi:mannose-1-phosphate guanylyltransferase
LSRIHAVIMAGGRGTRFWPASREALPKQFLTATGEGSLLRQTAQRLFPLAGPERTWVVTSAAHVDRAAHELPEMSRAHIVGEPVGRNTAPCIALAALLALREDEDAVLLVAPADHWIGDEDAFRETARTAIEFAEKHDALVTFGIAPASPETGYGYIEAGEELEGGARRVLRFTEKPNRQTAETFVHSGRHFWNSGIFVWKASVLRTEMNEHAAEIVKACETIASAAGLDAAMRQGYPSLPSISIDYALLEKSDRVYVVPARFPWSDIGSWDALASLLPQDAGGNAVAGDALLLESRNSFVRGSERLIAVLGMDGVIVVDTPDALLICPKDRAQDVKKIVEELEKRGRRELL